MLIEQFNHQWPPIYFKFNSFDDDLLHLFFIFEVNDCRAHFFAGLTVNTNINFLYPGILPEYLLEFSY
jgi:hypothetical protein